MFVCKENQQKNFRFFFSVESMKKKKSNLRLNDRRESMIDLEQYCEDDFVSENFSWN